VIGVESALSTWWMLQGMLSGGMLGLFLLGCVSKRVTSAQAAVATVAGIAVVAWVVLPIVVPCESFDSIWNIDAFLFRSGICLPY